jgi:enamine deaminase RidA (YjgF/YER057c/UK114 family)
MGAGIEARLRELGVALPAPPKPGGNYVSAKTVGSLVYLAGVVSSGAKGVITGTVGLDRGIEEGRSAARACALTQLAVLKDHLGSLDLVKSIVTLNGYVNAVAGFTDSPEVMNGASDFFVEVFGNAGRHVRAAVGVSALPRHALVELQMTVEIQNLNG